MPAQPKIAVQIEAQDRFTKTFGNARQAMTAFRREADDIGDSFATAVRRGAPIANTLIEAQQRARGVARAAMSINPAVAALGSATTIGGVAALANSFADAGLSLRNVGRMANMSVQDVAAFRGAARLTGVAASAADASLLGFGKALSDAVYGKNPQLAGYLMKLNINFGNMRDGVRDTAAVLKDFQPALARMYHRNPVAAQDFATLAGITPEGLSFFAQTTSEYERRLDVARRTLPVTQSTVEWAEKVAEAEGKMTNSAIGFRDTMMVAVAPTLTKHMDSLSAYVMKLTESETKVHALTAALEALAVNTVVKKLFGFGLGTVVANPVGALAVGTLTAGAAAGAMNTPMVDDLGRPIGNWGGTEGEKAAQAKADATQPVSGWRPGLGYIMEQIFGRSPPVGTGPGTTAPSGVYRPGIPGASPGPATTVPMNGNTQVQGGSALAPQGFANQYGAVAKWVGDQLGVDPKTILAQMHLETGGGRGVPGKNNPFNIVATSGQSGTAATDSTYGYTARFRNFDSLEQAAAVYVDKVKRQWPGVQGVGSDLVRFTAGLRVGQSGGYAESSGPDVESRRAKYEAGLRARAAQIPEPTPALASEPPRVFAPVQQLAPGAPVALSPEAQAAARPAAPAAAQDTGSTSTVRIDINHRNAPEGLTMNADVDGLGAEIGNMRIERPMPARSGAPQRGY